MDIQIDFGRLQSDIETLARFGQDAKSGGISRPSFSKADLEAREWLKDRIRSAGLALRQDGAGNIFGRLEGSGKTVMAGSHIDTVLNGGKFDGATGVLAALECLRRIKEEGLPVSRPLEVASFTDEEGNLVGDFLGSRAFTGQLNKEEILHGRTRFGPGLKEILEGTEFTTEGILNACADRPELEAFVELHIEQGLILETEEIPIGLVDVIAGKRYRLGAFIGKAAHAGTMPLELRRDAFLGLAEFALNGTRRVAANHYGSLVTFGSVSIHPGFFSIVPEKAEFTIDVRGLSPETLRTVDRELLAMAEDIASGRGLSFASKIVDETEPVGVPKRLLDLMEEECRKKGDPFMRIPSGAGHDAQILASCCDSGMIFIPSLDGISHAPDENIRWEDLEKGADLLLRTLLRLAGA